MPGLSPERGTPGTCARPGVIRQDGPAPDIGASWGTSVTAGEMHEKPVLGRRSSAQYSHPPWQQRWSGQGQCSRGGPAMSQGSVRVSRLVRSAVVVSVLAAVAATLQWLSPVPAQAYPSMMLPFAEGQTWYVCQGYNSQGQFTTHGGKPWLDVTTYSGRGSNGCSGGQHAAAGAPILAPADGTARTWDTNAGGVCVTFDGGGSFIVYHPTLSGTAASAVASDWAR